jgi:thioredoxin 1
VSEAVYVKNEPAQTGFEVDMSQLLVTSDSAFEADVLLARVPVLVDFGAAWCHPCKQLDPILEELASEWSSKVKIVRLDVDANPDATVRCGVMGVPTLILFVDGQEVERLSGFQSKSRLLERLGPHLGA